MWPNGSRPLRAGAPPVRRSQRASRSGPYPATRTARPAARLTYGAPRASIQMRASQSASPSAPTGTVPAHWAVAGTAAVSSAPGGAGSRLLAAAVARHHSSGVCSTPPPGSSRSPTASRSRSSTRPSASETSPTLGPPAPRSMARTRTRVERRRRVPLDGGAELRGPRHRAVGGHREADHPRAHVRLRRSGQGGQAVGAAAAQVHPHDRRQVIAVVQGAVVVDEREPAAGNIGRPERDLLVGGVAARPQKARTPALAGVV